MAVETVTVLVATAAGPHEPMASEAWGALVTSHGGDPFETGNGADAGVFRSASSAVAAAIAALRHPGLAGRPRRVGFGIAVGDAEHQASTGSDGGTRSAPAGAALEAVLTQAATLAVTASGGRILASATVGLLAGASSDHDLAPTGAVPIPGLVTPLDVVEVVPLLPGDRTDERWRVPLPRLLALSTPIPFVARATEHALLQDAWLATEVGERNLVLVGGDAGTGKSRLVTEMAREIHEGGGLVLYGASPEALELPFQPFVEALDDALRALTAEDRAELAGGGVDELARLLPVLRGPVADGVNELGDPDAERFRLFESVVDLLARLAEHRPLLVVLEDLHWARRPTTRLLQHLVRSTRLGRVCVFATFRNAPADMGEALTEALPELRNRPGVSRVALSGFDAKGVRAFVSAVAAEDVGPGLEPVVRHLVAHTGGNAFLMGETWRHMVETGRVERRRGRWGVATPLEGLPSPDSVREVVQRRLSALPAPTRRLLELAAVAGTTFELVVLATAGELELGQAFEALEPALNMRLVEDAGADRFRFSHALVRQAVEESLSSGERRRVHLAIGGTLEQLGHRDLEVLAHHFVAAVPLAPPDVAMRYARRAATNATRLVAYDDAATILSSVLPFATEPAVRADVLLDLANARCRAGLTEESFDACEEAAAIARRLGDTRRLCRAALGMQEATWRGAGHGGRAAELLREALLDPPDLATRAELLSGLATALAFSGRDDEAVPVVEDALATARSVGDPALLLRVLLCPLFLQWRPATLALQMSAAEEGLRLAEEMGDEDAILPMADKLLVGLDLVGDTARYRAVLSRHGGLARRLRQPLFQLTDAQVRAQLAIDDGRFADAEAAAEEANSWSEILRHAAGGFGVQMFSIRREQGRLGEVRAVVEAVARLERPTTAWRSGLAALYAELGQIDEGYALLDDLVADDLASVPRDALWTGALSFLADACVTTGHRAAAELVHRELAPSSGLRVAIVGLASFGAADRYLGRLAEVRGRSVEAQRYLEAAVQLDERTGSPTWTSHSQYALGSFLVRRGRRHDLARAQQLLRSAQTTATALGMVTLARRCDDVLRAPAPAAPAPSGPVAPLTAREVAVLQLVARGQTNRQIGGELHVSEHTVANHVRAILVKTGCANRAEAAAWAQRTGLLPV